MLPFSIQIKQGLPVTEQILHAVKRAVVSGQLAPGDRFPSVRQLSLELGINPNTAHKVVATLVNEGVLVTTPAVGSVVAVPLAGGLRERTELLGDELERLLVEAKKLGLSLSEVTAAVEAHWAKFNQKNQP